jgi:hypothetical protein
VIDPKGDLTNLLLTFPALWPEDFEPWVDAGEAQRKGSRAGLRRGEPRSGRRGLASWDQDGERIRRLHAAAATSHLHAGQHAGGRSRSCRRSPRRRRSCSRTRALGDRVQSTARACSALVGIAGDPLRSREHMLVSSLLDARLARGQGYDLAQLIADVQKPPFDKVGVLDLESLLPGQGALRAGDGDQRPARGARLRVWLKGEPLDVQRLLYTADGKPRIACCRSRTSPTRERMFFVTLLLNSARLDAHPEGHEQPARAALHGRDLRLPAADREPAVKKPMLTLLKQARAFGLGVVLATQNPVDLDYKALSNMRHLAARPAADRARLARVLDGLEGVAGGIDRQELSRMPRRRVPRFSAASCCTTCSTNEEAGAVREPLGDRRYLAPAA